MAVSVRTRHVDAQTVSDEHGKGGEMLRQQVISENNLAGNATVASHIMYCEVDVIIRFIRIISVNIPDDSATMVIYRNRAGTIAALHATIALDDAGSIVTEISEEVALTVANNHLRADDSVYALVVRDSSSTDLADWGIFFGWMPDYHGMAAGHQSVTY